jgi:hypothetical protein
MRSAMDFESKGGTERPWTKLAFVRSFSTVSAHVHFQVAFLCEPVPADLQKTLQVSCKTHTT